MIELVIFVILPVFLFKENLSFIKEGVKGKFKIINSKEVIGSRGVFYHSIIEIDGQNHQSKYAKSTKPILGEEIEVLYKKDSNIVLEPTFMNVYYLPSLYLLLGIFIFLVKS